MANGYVLLLQHVYHPRHLCGGVRICIDVDKISRRQPAIQNRLRHLPLRDRGIEDSISHSGSSPAGHGIDLNCPVGPAQVVVPDVALQRIVERRRKGNKTDGLVRRDGKQRVVARIQ